MLLGDAPPRRPFRDRKGDILRDSRGRAPTRRDLQSRGRWSNHHHETGLACEKVLASQLTFPPPEHIDRPPKLYAKEGGLLITSSFFASTAASA